MTPREFEPKVVQDKLENIDRLLRQLETYGDITLDRLQSDPTLGLAVERILTLLVDLAVSVNTHVATTRHGVAPRSYRDSFDLAARAGLVPEELAARLAPSVGLRSVLVHAYVEVDYVGVVDAIPLAVESYREYVRHATRFLEQVERID